MPHSVYQALAPGKRNIRLMHLLPKEICNSSASDTRVSISCTISHVSLDHPPPYAALSYTWGDASQISYILVDGIPFNVTESLEVALLHLTPAVEPLTLWIDAICINQDDETEKTEQVQHMRQIYLQATSVITWLGPASENSDAAMLWIQHYGTLSHSFGIGTKPELRLIRLLQIFDSDPGRLRYQALEEFLQNISTQLSSRACHGDSVSVALHRLFTRPYWSRVWVVQELAHAKSVQFVCGNMMVSEEALHHSQRLLRNLWHYERLKAAQNPQSINSEPEPIALDLGNSINMLKVRRAAGHPPLIYLIRSFRNFQSTDPRDRIFAFLSLATDAPGLGLDPDYADSCQEVYLKTTMSLLRSGIFDILSLCEVHKTIPDLPSWVPDFSSLSKRSFLQQRAAKRNDMPITTVLQPNFSASGRSQNSSVSYEFPCKSPTTLQLHAKLVGKVTRMGPAWEKHAASRWLQELMGLFHADSNAEESDHLRAVLRTAVADQEVRQAGEKPRLSETELEKVYNLLRDIELSTADSQMFDSLGLGGYLHQLEDIAHGRRPFGTSKGLIGIGPREMELGDLLYILNGAHIPYILRPNAQSGLHLIGEAYAHGIMDGEFMEDDQPLDLIAIS